jgi:class 3 adenylate cyclase/tetratricopeptide (TPR) repeat protein
MQQIVEWLQKLGLGQYAHRFAENDINFGILPYLTDQDLKELGITSLGHRRQLLLAIAELHSDQKSASLPSSETGAPIAPHDTAERRQVTVMFSDLVGSTALSAPRDPEDLREVISAYQKCVAETVRRLGGFVAQYMGDGVLIYFGYPRAHEDDAERAVRAGLELVASIRDLKTHVALQTRVGIATGMVVVGDLSGSGADIVGETPNLAARLQAIAEPDSVVIAESTRKLMGNLFELKDLGAQDLKGIAGPVRVWAALRPSSAASRFEALHASGLTELVGREEELQLLLRRWSKAKTGEGQVVLLSGEAGIGKSRLTAALLERLTSEPHTRLRYFCSPQHTDSALYPIIGQMERAAGIAYNDTLQTKLDKLDALLTQTATSIEDAELLADMLSLRNDGRYRGLNLSATQRRDRTLEALTLQIEALAKLNPVLMIFEDAQWADPTSLEALGQAANRIATRRVLLIVTFRPEFNAPWIGRPHVTPLTINRLGQREVSAMIDGVVGNKSLAESVREDIIERTDGIPLFVEELTKAVLEAESHRAAEHAIAVIPPPALEVPASLHASLMARLDRLGPAKEVAQIGAAIGREFSYELIAAVAPGPKAVLKHALERLTASGLAFRRGTPAEATYSFKHALVQDAAYDSLLKSKRQELHAKIARAIEERFPNIKATQPEVLAHHYTRAGLFKQGAAYWLEAGQKALSGMALTEAVAHLEAGLGVIGNLPASKARDRSELECRVLLGTAWEAYRGWPAPQLAEVLKPALPLARAARQPKLLAPTLWGLWVQMMSVGPVAESLVWAEELLSAGEDLADEELLLVGHMAVMVTNFWLGNPLVVERHARAIMERYVQERHGQIVKSVNHDPKTLAGIYLPLVLWMLGYPDRAVAIVHERDSHARRIGHPFDSGFVLTLGAWVFHYRREPEKQYACNKAIQKLARDSGLPFLSEVLAPFLSTGISLAQMGRLSEGIEHMQTGIRLWESAGARTVTPYIRSRLGEALALSGDVEGGLSHVDAMLEQISRPGWQERGHLAEILRLKGWMLSLKGDFAGAEKNYLASFDWAREQQAKSWELRAAMSMARLWRDQGKPQQARELLAPVYGWFTEGFDTLDLKEAKALLEELAVST